MGNFTEKNKNCSSYNAVIVHVLVTTKTKTRKVSWCTLAVEPCHLSDATYFDCHNNYYDNYYTSCIRKKELLISENKHFLSIYCQGYRYMSGSLCEQENVETQSTDEFFHSFFNFSH